MKKSFADNLWQYIGPFIVPGLQVGFTVLVAYLSHNVFILTLICVADLILITVYCCIKYGAHVHSKKDSAMDRVIREKDKRIDEFREERRLYLPYMNNNLNPPAVKDEIKNLAEFDMEQATID